MKTYSAESEMKRKSVGVGAGVITYVAFETIAQAFYLFKNYKVLTPGRSIFTISSELLIIALLSFVGIFCLSVKGKLAAKLFEFGMICVNTTVLAELGFYIRTGQKIHAEILSFVREQFRHYVMAGTDNGLSNLISHSTNFIMLPILCAFTVSIVSSHGISAILHKLRLSAHKLGAKSWKRWTNPLLALCALCALWSYNQCTSLDGIGRLGCECYVKSSFDYFNLSILIYF